MIITPENIVRSYETAGKPRPSPTASTVGFINLNSNDIIFSSFNGYAFQNILTSDTGSITAIVNTSISSNSRSTFGLIQVLLSRSFITKQILTGSNSSYISAFKSVNSSDLVNDNTFKIGNSSIIAIKKAKFGESIRPLSFSASTESGTYVFSDSYSANNSFGIISCTNQGTTLSAGVIFYDLGLIFIHGPNQNAISSISSLTAVSFYSSYKLNSLNVFCTANASELNYTYNENAFYKKTITSDPSNTTVSSTLTSTTTALNFAIGHVEFAESASACFDLDSSTDFTLETHISASSLTSTQFIISHINSTNNIGYSLSYDVASDSIFFNGRGGFSISLQHTSTAAKQAISANNYAVTGLVNTSVVRRGNTYTLYTGWIYYNNTNGITSIAEYTTSGVSNAGTSFTLNDKIYIGSSGNNSVWTGLINNVKLYKFALNSLDLKEHTINPSSTSFTNTTSGTVGAFTVHLPFNENRVLSGANNIIANTASATVTGYAVSALTANNNYFILNSSNIITSGLSAYNNAYMWGINSTLTSGRSNYYLSGLYNRSPYVTTVGLYNDNNVLLAVAKLAQPIRKPETIPFTVRVNLDLQ